MGAGAWAMELPLASRVPLSQPTHPAEPLSLLLQAVLLGGPWWDEVRVGPDLAGRDSGHTLCGGDSRSCVYILRAAVGVTRGGEII